MVVVKVLQTLLCLRRIRVFLPQMALVLCGLAGAQTPPDPDASVLHLHGATAASTSLTPYWSILIDPTRALQEGDVLGDTRAHEFKALQAVGNAVGLGVRKDAVWLQARINNPPEESISRILETSYASLNLVDVVLVQADGQVLTHQKMGTARPMSDRALPGRFFHAPLELPPKSALTLLVRVESHAPIIIPATLWEPEAFAQHDKSDYSVQAWYFGLASAMFTFNVLLLLALRDKVYF